jgi:carboxyl-terminal processing protease
MTFPIFWFLPADWSLNFSLKKFIHALGVTQSLILIPLPNDSIASQISQPLTPTTAAAAASSPSTNPISKNISAVTTIFTSPTIALLAPIKTQYQTKENITALLQQAHYRKIPFDDRLSEEILNSYLNYLDGQKSFFLQSDIDEFQAYRHSMDNALLENRLDAGFAIFNRYQQRAEQRFIYSLQLLDKGFNHFNFNENESLVLDRRKEHWLTNMDNAQKLWASQLKAALLNLKLTQKAPEAIIETLQKRYQNQLTRLSQNTSDDAFQAYMNSITQVFDPHTEYLSPRTSENFDINMKLSLEGIGAVLQNEDSYTKIVRLVPAGPAEKSKLLHPADRIIAVGQGNEGDMVDVIGWRIDEVVELVRGPKGSKVRLEIIPFDAENEQATQIISIVRDKVMLEEQAAQSKIIVLPDSDQFKDSKMGQHKNYKIGVITVPTFYLDFKGFRNSEPNYRSSTRDVAILLESLQKQQIDALVIDLRDNGGGSLQEANTLLGLFIRSGPTVQTRNFKGSVDVYEDTDDRILYSGPLAVMVNRLSASASEIFAGAIQDYQRGLIIGSPTFGKGTVQSLEKLTHGQLKITQAKFYRISGSSNQNLGIIPDIIYPDLYDSNIIGESTLDYALPWDTILPIKYQPFSQLRPYFAQLTTEHQKRIQTDPDFQYLLQQLKLNQVIEKETHMNLNEAQRIKQREERNQQRLSIENAHRKAKGLTVLTALPNDRNNEDLQTFKEKVKDSKDALDPLLQETGNILRDLISLQQKSNEHHIAITQ